MKKREGFSLIEIVVGIVLIALFIISTGLPINAAYNNYRLIWQRNEALEFAIEKMEEVLQSGDIEDTIKESARAVPETETLISDVGYTRNNMEARVKIERIKDNDQVYKNRVFLVTINVTYSRTPTDTKKYDIGLQSLKVIK